jgi:hypothetical protein
MKNKMVSEIKRLTGAKSKPIKPNKPEGELLAEAIIRMAQELSVLATNARRWEAAMREYEKDPPIDFDLIYWPKGTRGKLTATWVQSPASELTRSQGTETTEMLTQIARKLLVVASNVHNIVGEAFVASGGFFHELRWPIGTPDKLTCGSIKTPQEVLQQWEEKQKFARRAKSDKNDPAR